jgi:sporulation protein YlmC with PRC-barrel domain
MMNKLVSATALTLLISTAVMAQSTPPAPSGQAVQPAAGAGVKIMNALPADATTVTNFYKQSVYDPSDNKIGDVADLLVDKDGKIEAAMLGVGGFLGAGEKDVAIPFSEMRMTTKNNKTYLMVNTTKDALKAAPGFKYDREKTTWVPDTSSNTVGSGSTSR